MISMEEDDDLLQDFLVDAGEILEALTQQVVDLEKSPEDKEIINAVFRGFHTIKGGASFLSLEPLVALCHRTEDLFNVIRNGERSVTSEVMDVVLPVLDVLKEQFTELSSGKPPREAEPWLLDKLDEIMNEGKNNVVQVPSKSKKRNTKISNKKKTKIKVKAGAHDNTSSVSTSASVNESDGKDQLNVINSDVDEGLEQEFESLLNEFQNQRKGILNAQQVNRQKSSPASEQSASVDGSEDDDVDDITEEEFEALLDNLQNGNPTSHSRIPTNNPSTGTVPKMQSQASAVKFGTTHSENTSDHRSQSTATNKKATANKDGVQSETTVRVDTKRLDDIMNLVGELVLVRNRMTSLEGVIQNEDVSKVVNNLDLVTADLQTAVMKTRMQPIKKVFGRFPRVVRDLARSLKKEVSLELQGEDTDLDKNLVEALADPLVHLVRNAVDHGIEMPDEREANGKSRKGTVILTAEQEGDHILLTIEDDGKGMDADQIRKTAVSKGMMDEDSAARLDNKECYNLIFQPGFSTKTVISDVSGRGVGMDVVKTRIEQLNGSVEIDSVKGKGSKIIIKVPLTLAIMPTLMVMVDSQIFALPLASVNEIFHLNLTKTNIIDGQLVVMVRKKALPLFYLRHWLIKGAKNSALPKEGHVVVVSLGVQKIGFVVDQLIGQEEVVIKPLGALLHGMKGMSGATITGDGRISLILDIPGLMQKFARRI